MLMRLNRPATFCPEHTTCHTALDKQEWDVLKLDALRFWVEEVRHGNKSGVQYRKDDESSLFEIQSQLQSHRSEGIANTPQSFFHGVRANDTIIRFWTYCESVSLCPVRQLQNLFSSLPHPIWSKDMGVILTTAKTAIQFQPEAIACMRVLVLVLFSSLG